MSWPISLGFAVRSPQTGITRMSVSDSPVRIWPAIARAAAGKCPACGRGKFFRSYLHQMVSCRFCGEHFSVASTSAKFMRRRTRMADNHDCPPFGGAVILLRQTGGSSRPFQGPRRRRLGLLYVLHFRLRDVLPETNASTTG